MRKCYFAMVLLLLTACTMVCNIIHRSFTGRLCCVYTWLQFYWPLVIHTAMPQPYQALPTKSGSEDESHDGRRPASSPQEKYVDSRNDTYRTGFQCEWNVKESQSCWNVPVFFQFVLAGHFVCLPIDSLGYPPHASWFQALGWPYNNCYYRLQSTCLSCTCLPLAGFSSNSAVLGDAKTSSYWDIVTHAAHAT